RRRITAADQGQDVSTFARGASLAHRRTQGFGRKEILSRQRTREHPPSQLGSHDQGPMGLRAGAPAVEGRTWPSSLRGPILARTSPSRAHDHDRLRFPSVPPPRDRNVEKKESTPHRPNQLCPPSVTPFSRSWLDRLQGDVHTAENGSATSGGMSKNLPK